MSGLSSLSSLSARCIRAAALAALLFQCGELRAADWYTGASDPKAAKDWIVAMDASVSATTTGTEFASVGGTTALSGSMSESGARLRIDGLAGTYRFISTTTGNQIRGEQSGGSVMAGYEWKSPGTSFSAYGGIDLQETQFSSAEAGLPASGAQQGIKGSFEYFTTLSDRTVLFAFGTYSTIYNSYFTKLKLGVAMPGQIYVGPEVAALGDDFYQQWRFGGQVSGIRFAGMQFGLSAGYQVDKSGQKGAYGSIDVSAVY